MSSVRALAWTGHYNKYAKLAFASEALGDRTKSDLAWGLFTEGLMVAEAGRWEHALSMLRSAAEHLHALGTHARAPTLD